MQTHDGYMWIGTSAGLVRFDGVRFVPWTPGDGGPWFSSNSVCSLLGGSDGSLWIGTGSNLARLKDGRLFNYTNGPDASTRLSKTAAAASGSRVHACAMTPGLSVR